MNTMIYSGKVCTVMWNLKMWCQLWWLWLSETVSALNQRHTLFQKHSSAHKGKADSREKINENAVRLLNCYGNAVLRMAYSYLHNMEDAEDVLQDTMIKYLQNTPKLKSTDHEKAWLLCVAANISKNKIEYNRIRETDELDELLAAEEKEDLSFVWKAVKELPETYREVIHLFYYEGYPTAAIAKILIRNENSVRSDLSRGRKKLRKILKERYDFEQVI